MTNSVHRHHGDSIFKTRDVLNAVENSPPNAAVRVVAKQLLQSVGATEVEFLIADMSGESMYRMTKVHAGDLDVQDDSHRIIAIDDTRAGLALRRQQPQIVSDDSDVWVYAPVTARGDAMGVLELRLSALPSDEVLSEIAATAHALAYIVVANGRHTDLFEWGRRTRPMSLAAEIQRRLAPDAFTCEAGQFTLAGWLEPTVESAGDTFDYSFDDASLSISMTDAMGHSLDSALLSTVAVSALRCARRNGVDLVERAKAANMLMIGYAGPQQFVTGLLVEVPLSGRLASVVNAGHPSPFLVRDGAVQILSLESDTPFGMFPGVAYRRQELDLQPGDRLILMTDGLLERGAEAFDLQGAILDLASLHPREFVRDLCREVVTAVDGRLQDDATVLCLDWHGGKKTNRRSTSGADDLGAST